MKSTSHNTLVTHMHKLNSRNSPYYNLTPVIKSVYIYLKKKNVPNPNYIPKHISQSRSQYRA